VAGTRALGRAGTRLIETPSYTCITAVNGREDKTWQTHRGAATSSRRPPIVAQANAAV
jgi:hypothetical protein